MNCGEPVVTIHGEDVEQGFLLMVESALVNGVQFSHDGQVLADPQGRANPDALAIMAGEPFRVALALDWLRAHGRLPHHTDQGANHDFQR